MRAGRPNNTLALVGQDNLRRTILGVRDYPGNPALGLIDMTARWALAQGLDVVVEGILYAEYYGPMLRNLARNLARNHRGVTSCYLYDLTFEETLRRRATKAATFGEPEMRTWWHGHQPIDGLDKAVIPASEGLDETVARILAVWT